MLICLHYLNSVYSVNLGLRVVFNLKVYYLAKIQYPEFDGFKGCKYPGTPSPRQIAFTARESGPFDQEKKIFLTPKSIDKDENIIHFNSAIQIFLTPATPTPNPTLLYLFANI